MKTEEEIRESIELLDMAMKAYGQNLVSIQFLVGVLAGLRWAIDDKSHLADFVERAVKMQQKDIANNN